MGNTESRDLLHTASTTGVIQSSNQRPHEQQQLDQSDKSQAVVLAGRGMQVIPEQLFRQAKYAQSLDLSRNHLIAIPDAIACCTKLERLSLGNNMIRELPEGMGKLKRLKWLDLTHNKVHALPSTFGDLKGLLALGVSDCSLTQFPPVILKMTGLRKIGLFNNVIPSVPREICNLTYLNKLDLSGNALKSLPEEIGKLKHLEWINLANNQLECLPATFEQLSELQEIGLCNNKLEELPYLGKMTKLTILSAYGNQLRALPESVLLCTSLVKLDVSGNLLLTIPTGLMQLPLLEFLSVKRNKIRRLALNEKLGKSLVKLEMQENELEWLPASLFTHIRQPIDFKVSGNNFTFKPPQYTPQVPRLLEILSRQLIICNSATRKQKRIPEYLFTHLRERVLRHSCQGCGKPFGWTPCLVIDERLSPEGHPMAVLCTLCSASCLPAERD